MTFQTRRAPGEFFAAHAGFPPGFGVPAAPVRSRLAGPIALDRVTAVLLAAIALLLVGIGVVATWPTTAPMNPVTLRAQALAASEQAGWVHVDALNVSFDVGPNEGSEVVDSPTEGSADVVLVDNVAYLRADSNFLEQGLELPPQIADSYDNQWLSFQPGDPDFLQVASDLSLYSMVSQAFPTGSVRLLPATTMDGQRVLGLAGTTATIGGVSASVTAWVQAAAPHRIVASVARAHNTGLSLTTTATFSHWGEKVSLGAPAGAIPFVSIGGQASRN